MFGNHAAHETEGERYSAISADNAFVRFFQPRHHVDQGCLASAVWCQNAQACSQLDLERDTVKNNLPLNTSPIGFAYIFGF